MKKILLCLLAMALCSVCFFACNKTSESESGEQAKVIEFTQAEISLCVGSSVQAEVLTEKKNVYVYWYVTDESVATVSDTGLITAISEGQTVCYAEYNGVSAMCLIKVSAKQATPMLSVSVPYTNNEITIYVGDFIELESQVKNGNDIVSDANVEYSVADGAIAGVDGVKLTGLSAGETTVTILVTVGEKTAQTIVKVKIIAQD